MFKNWEWNVGGKLVEEVNMGEPVEEYFKSSKANVEVKHCQIGVRCISKTRLKNKKGCLSNTVYEAMFLLIETEQ